MLWFRVQEISWHDKQGTAHLLWKLGADVPSLKLLVGAARTKQV